MLAEAKSITCRLVVTALLVTAPAAAAVEWREAPAYAALFAPAGHRGAYRAATTMAPLDEVVKDIRNHDGEPAPDGWAIRDEQPQDAFGTGGAYNRWQVALVYGSTQPRVSRGVRMDRGRVVEAWTLISPYPSPDLRRLEPGTLRLVLTIAR